MSHIYQPLLVRSLVESGGAATIRQLAQSFLTQDESQLQYYEKRIKEMPLKVLSRHNVVAHQDDLVSLNTGPLSFEQKAEIIMTCNRRMLEYMKKRGIAIWDYRLLDSDPVSDSLRYQVLKDSGGHCCLCGATLYERPLDVDHIIPRSREARPSSRTCRRYARNATGPSGTRTRPTSACATEPKRMRHVSSARMTLRRKRPTRTGRYSPLRTGSRFPKATC